MFLSAQSVYGILGYDSCQIRHTQLEPFFSILFITFCTTAGHLMHSCCDCRPLTRCLSGTGQGLAARRSSHQCLAGRTRAMQLESGMMSQCRRCMMCCRNTTRWGLSVLKVILEVSCATPLCKCVAGMTFRTLLTCGSLPQTVTFVLPGLWFCYELL